MFYREKPISMTESLLNLMPNDVFVASSAVKLIMNTNVFKFFFPELISEVGLNVPIDLKCGFNKEYLTSGSLEQDKISNI